MNDGLADVDRRVVGTKQVLRALDEGKVAHAYVAQVESMEKLGRACGIDVKAAAAGLLK